ncbi:TniB family NTP-binding protein [Thiomicrospira pelophila]|uniref:TniB family NTP-binding protein n=1 Tax=Thiomicrospira pelophila TaxID=934 RepID=UPI0004A75E3F|nr:TniB family NTP-binding protein [Thiomicrospira pelophila]
MTTDTIEQNYPHLLERIRPVVDLPDKERLFFIEEDHWIGYDRAQKILNLLEDLLARPKKVRPQSLLIVGDPNMGKTTIILEFVKRHYTEVIEEPDSSFKVVKKPVINIAAPTSSDEKSLFIAILDHFFAPFRPTDPKAKLRQQAIHLMQRFQTRMLIIDELHNFLSGGPAGQRESMIALKNLSNELGLSIVGVGTKDAVQVLHTDPQHASRFDVAELPKWDLDTNFLKLLASYEKLLPIKYESDLKSKELATTLYQISSGNLGDLNKLLVACAKSAIETGEEKITHAIIMSHKDIKPTKGQRNIRYIDL